MDNEKIFSETEDTPLKQFLSGNRIYTMLAAAIICAIVFIPTLANIIGIYKNVKKSENVMDISEVNLASDLDGQYITGSAYKFLARLGYIAESEEAATDFYYIMFIDTPDGEQVATLVKADKRGDEDMQLVIDAYLSYAEDPDAGYLGNVLEISGKFQKMTRQEQELFEEGISRTAINSPMLGDYTLKLEPLPTPSDTVPYWFFAVPFGAGLVVSVILFIYGLRHEEKRAKANASPYPYQNRKNKKRK